MQPTDPNNTLGNPNSTHINAYFADLEVAKQELALAQGKVQAAKDAIVAQGGTPPPDADDADDVQVAGDEAQLAQDEATDKADDASEAPESDAPVTPPVPPEGPAGEDPAEETAPQPGDVVQPTV